ncbi:MAG: metallophosphoesterase family protein [Planctomycetia bacterium]|nr:metallophosphoesterase family protein [Planctomycetia bacterium]
MLLGVVSDSHGQLDHTLRAVRMLESLSPVVVIHCGDIGSTAVIELFRPWPTHYVFGNVDRDEAELRQAIVAAGHQCHERFGELELAGRRIAFLHSDDLRRFRETTSSGQYDLVCYGHTHRAEQHTEGKTLILNPGAMHRANPHSIAVVDLETMLATVVAV